MMKYSRKMQDNIFELKAKEFIFKSDPRKFEGKKYSDLVFFDGTSMNSWFNNNKIKILTSDSGTCKVIVQQYLKYKKSHKLSYKQKLYIFECENRMAKFNINDEDISFMDEELMSKWFYNNKLKVLEDSKAVRIQYLIYNEGCITDLNEQKKYTDKDFEIYKKYKNLK